MEQSSSERKQTVRHQFDSFCKMVLHGEKVNYEKEMEYRGDGMKFLCHKCRRRS